MNDSRAAVLAAVVVAALVAVVAAWRDLGQVQIVVAAVVAAGVTFAADRYLQRVPSEGAIAGVPAGGSKGDPGSATPGSPAPPTNPDTPSAATKPRATKHSPLDMAKLIPNSYETTNLGRKRARGFTLRIAKHGNGLAECEDAIATDLGRSLLAVADGASSSFGAAPWAAALAAGFVSQPPSPMSVESLAEWVERCRAPETSSANAGETGKAGWWAAEGERRGAFSTIVGAGIVTVGDRTIVKVMCLGDSCAFVLRGERGARRLRRSIPYEESSQFGSHPILLGSSESRSEPVQPSWTSIPVARHDLLLLASDALSEWLLEDPSRFATLEAGTPAEVAEMFIEQRAGGHMVNDDLALIALEVA